MPRILKITQIIPHVELDFELREDWSIRQISTSRMPIGSNSIEVTYHNHQIYEINHPFSGDNFVWDILLDGCPTIWRSHPSNNRDCYQQVRIDAKPRRKPKRKKKKPDPVPMYKVVKNVD